MPVFKNNIVTPFQTGTYWIYNPFLSHTMSAAYHKYNLQSGRGFTFIYMCEQVFGKLRKEVEHTMFQFLKYKNKSSFKQARNQITMIYSSPCCDPSANVLVITENLMACSEQPKMHKLSLLVIAICMCSQKNICSIHVEQFCL